MGVARLKNTQIAVSTLSATHVYASSPTSAQSSGAKAKRDAWVRATRAPQIPSARGKNSAARNGPPADAGGLRFLTVCETSIMHCSCAPPYSIIPVATEARFIGMGGE